MVQALGGAYIPLSSYALIGGSGRRIGVPVQRSQAIYAQFEHVYGVPEKQGGASLDRVHILNALIDRLATARGRSSPPQVSSGASDPSILDALIIDYEKELRSEAAKPSRPYHPAPSLPSAIAVDLLI